MAEWLKAANGNGRYTVDAVSEVRILPLSATFQGHAPWQIRDSQKERTRPDFQWSEIWLESQHRSWPVRMVLGIGGGNFRQWAPIVASRDRQLRVGSDNVTPVGNVAAQ